MPTQAVTKTAVRGLLEQLKKKGEEPSEELRKKMDDVRADYEQQLDARYGAARGFVDDVILPEETRDRLSFALRAALHYPGPHLGPWGELGPATDYRRPATESESGPAS